MEKLPARNDEKVAENDEAASELNFKIRKYDNAGFMAFVR